jgi:hypothetical protein
MSQLRSFRLGWQSQNLARFILYKFCFLTEPVQVADDIGVDYICTLFETRKRGNNDELLPRNSFAIQVKSEGEISPTKRLDLSPHLAYLERLELPYFLGIVNRDHLKLTIYSGEFLTAFFAYRGLPSRLEVELCQPLPPEKTDDWLKDIAGNGFLLKFPMVAEITASVGDDELRATVDLMHHLCSTMLGNIAAKLQGLHIFNARDPGQRLLFASAKSFEIFQDGLQQHLAQIFFHLNFLYTQSPAQGRPDVETLFRLYERFYNDLASRFNEANLPAELVQTYRDAKMVVEGSS